MFLVFITGCISAFSYWWSVDKIPFAMKATLWSCRVTALGFAQDDLSWNDVCDRSQVFTQFTIGDIDGLCRALPAIRTCTVLTLALAFVSLSMTISMWIGACSKSEDKLAKAKIRKKCLNVRFVFDFLCFAFGCIASGLGFGVLTHVSDQGASSPRAETGLFAMGFGAVVAFMIALITMVRSMMQGFAELDEGSKCKSKSPSVHWRPNLWYHNQRQPATFSGGAFPQPCANGYASDYAVGRANIHSYDVEMYPQNFNQFAQPAPQQQAQQPCPFQAPLAPHPAPACQRVHSGAERAYIGHMACPPHMQMQTVQPQRQPSMAPPPRPFVAPVQADFGLGASRPQDTLTHVELTIMSSEQQYFHRHHGHSNH